MIRRMNEGFVPNPSDDPMVSIDIFRDILNDYYGKLESIMKKEYALREDADSIQTRGTFRMIRYADKYGKDQYSNLEDLCTKLYGLLDRLEEITIKYEEYVGYEEEYLNNLKNY